MKEKEKKNIKQVYKRNNTVYNPWIMFNETKQDTKIDLEKLRKKL